MNKIAIVFTLLAITLLVGCAAKETTDTTTNTTTDNTSPQPEENLTSDLTDEGLTDVDVDLGDVI